MPRPSSSTATTTSSPRTSPTAGRSSRSRPRWWGRSCAGAAPPTTRATSRWCGSASPRTSPPRVPTAPPCTSNCWPRARRSPARRTSRPCSRRTATRWPATRSSSPTPAWSAATPRPSAPACAGWSTPRSCSAARRSTCTRASSAGPSRTRSPSSRASSPRCTTTGGASRCRASTTTCARPPTAERDAWAALPFDEPAWLAGSAAGARATSGEAGWSTYERLWARPTAEVNGLHGGYAGPGHKTIVPHSATAKLTFRLVADQDPARVLAAVRDFVAAHTPAGIEAEVSATGPGVPPLICDVDSILVTTIREAMGVALGAEVLPAREGGSGPEALLSTELAAPLAFLGVMLPSDRIHAPDERAVLPLLLEGAEATAHLWRLLGERGVGLRLAFERTRSPSVEDMTTAQTPIGSGFGAATTAARGAGGHRPHRPPRGRHGRLLGPRPRGDARAHRGRRPRRRPRPAPGRGEGGARRDRAASSSTPSTSATSTASPPSPSDFLASGRAIDMMIDNAGIMATPGDAGRARAGRPSSRPTTSATSRWSTGCGRRSSGAATRASCRCRPRGPPPLAGALRRPRLARRALRQVGGLRAGQDGQRPVRRAPRRARRRPRRAGVRRCTRAGS